MDSNPLGGLSLKEMENLVVQDQASILSTNYAVTSFHFRMHRKQQNHG